MSRFNTLMHGNLDAVIDELNNGPPLGDIEMRAALSNVASNVRALTTSMKIGVPGTAVCVCRMPPNHDWPNKKLLILDHRCKWHGEQAQPDVWGRHKELALEVERKVWDSLGITYDGSPEAEDPE